MATQVDEQGDRRTILLDPYPGLRPFAETEQRLFFGRTQQVNDILQRLERSSFAVVTGGSGSGKSSIVNAGVIPALRKKQLSSRSDFWLVASFSPKDQPFRNLASELAKLIEPLPGQSPSDLIYDVEQTLLEINSLQGFFVRYGSRIVLEEGQAPESRNSANLLIVCDQFEEIFREQNRDNPEADQLVHLLVEAYKNQDKSPRLFVIIGMRSEDLHRCAAFIDLPSVINGSMFLTRRLNETEIASAIVEPMRLSLRLRGIRPSQYKPIQVDPWPFEVDILRRLNLAASTIARDSDHLPLLQHLLSVLWRYLEQSKAVPVPSKTADEYQKFHITTHHLVAALGFPSIEAMDEFIRSSDKAHPQEKWNEAWILKRALDGAAEAMKPSDSRLSAITARMFRLLAEIDDRGNYKRRWTSRREILAVTADEHATAAEVDQVIAAFSEPYPFLNARAGLDGKIDVSHEAFIRNWTQFVNWLKNEQHLATAYDLLRNKYLEYRRLRSKQQGNPLARIWLLLSNRLNNEQLVELADWRRTRSENSAWASRYANGIRGEDPEFHQTSTTYVKADELNKNLLNYYGRSKLLSYSAVSFSLLAAFALVGVALLWLEASQQFAASNRELVSQAAASIANAPVDPPSGVDTRDISDRLHELTHSGALVLHVQRPKEEGPVDMLHGWYRTVTLRTHDPSRQYYIARRAIDKATRRALDNAVFPISERRDARDYLDKEQSALSPACKAQLEKSDVLMSVFQGRDSLKDPGRAYTTWGPLEREGGWQIALAPTTSGGLVLLLLSENSDTCVVQYIQSLSLPPGDLRVDQNLKLVLVNYRPDKPENRETFIYRIWWMRHCSPDTEVVSAVDKCPPISAEIRGPAKLRRSNYRILDENHIEREDDGTKGKKQFALTAHHRPVLLSEAEANKVRFRDQRCVMSGRYAASLRESDNASIDDGPAKALHIFEHAVAIKDCDQIASSGQAIAVIPIRDQSVLNIAFSEPKSDDSEPEFIYLQGSSGNQDAAAVYKLALIPKQMMSCLATRDVSIEGTAPRTEQYDGLLRSQKISETDLQELSNDLVVPRCDGIREVNLK